MDKKLQSGQRVTVVGSGGTLTLVIVQDLGEIVLLCRQDEYEASKRDGREAICVGFKKRDVVRAST